MFFEDPSAAFCNIRKAVAPNGRLAFVCWRAMDENGWAATPIKAARPLLPPQETLDLFAPGPFAFADAKRVEVILSSAGFKDIHIEKFDGHMDMAATAEEAAMRTMAIGPLSRATAELDDAAKAKIRDVVTEALKAYATPHGVRGPVACWLVKAKAETGSGAWWRERARAEFGRGGCCVLLSSSLCWLRSISPARPQHPSPSSMRRAFPKPRSW